MIIVVSLVFILVSPLLQELSNSHSFIFLRSSKLHVLLGLPRLLEPEQSDGLPGLETEVVAHEQDVDQELCE